LKTAVIILSHGSKIGGAEDAVRQVCAEVKKRGGYEIVECAYLQYSEPALHDVIEHCVRREAMKITIVPFFMQRGTHVAADIPAVVENAKRRHPRVDIKIADHAGSHPLMTEIVMDLAGRKK